MTDKQKIEAILSLLTDKNVYKLHDKGQLKDDEELFGAILFSTHTFAKAYKIARS